MTESDIHYPEDGVWTQEDVEKFVESVNEEDYELATGGDGGDEQPPVHPGAVMVGIVLFGLIVYSLYAGEMMFAYLNTILLVVLALGSKAMN